MNIRQAELATLSQKRWELCYPNLAEYAINLYIYIKTEPLESESHHENIPI